MKIGIQVEGQEDLTWDRWLGMMRQVEDLGLESLWRSDHLFSDMGPATRNSLEAWTSLTAVALKTSRIEFGPLVSPLTLRDPVTLARMAAAVDIASEGRLVLGLGGGWDEAEHSAFGFPFPTFSERMDRLEEGIQVIRALWSGGPVDFDGAHYKLKGATAYPRPHRTGGPPILIGGDGEGRLLRLVAKYADEWNSTVASPDAYRRKSAKLAEHCASVDRDPNTIRRSWMGGICIGRSDKDLKRRIEWLKEFLANGAIGPDLQPVSVEELVRQGTYLFGTPSVIADQLRGWEAAGVERVMTQVLDLDDHEVLELISEVAAAVA